MPQNGVIGLKMSESQHFDVELLNSRAFNKFWEWLNTVCYPPLRSLRYYYETLKKFQWDTCMEPLPQKYNKFCTKPKRVSPQKMKP